MRLPDYAEEIRAHLAQGDQKRALHVYEMYVPLFQPDSPSCKLRRARMINYQGIEFRDGKVIDLYGGPLSKKICEGVEGRKHAPIIIEAPKERVTTCTKCDEKMGKHFVAKTSSETKAEQLVELFGDLTESDFWPKIEHDYSTCPSDPQSTDYENFDRGCLKCRISKAVSEN